MKESARELINYTFQAVLVSYLLLLLLEEIKRGFVSKYLNLNYALVLVVVLGVLTVILPYQKPKEQFDPFKKENKTFDYLFTISLGIIGALIIFYKTKELKWLSYVISIVAGILIILLSILVLEEDEQN